MSQGQSSNLSDALSLWKEKHGYLEIEKAKTASAPQKFELQKDIEQCEREIHRLESAGFVRHKGTSASKAQAFASPNKRQGWENAPDASRSSSSQTNKAIEIEVFICYSPSPKDQKMLEQLEINLSSFQREGIIKIWHPGKMRGGQRRLVEINNHLNSAHVILLLISPRFLADYELNSLAEKAMQREEACVIPVLISSVANWNKTRFGGLSPLPKNGKPVNDKSWGNQDFAFSAIAEGFGEIVEELASKQL